MNPMFPVTWARKALAAIFCLGVLASASSSKAADSCCLNLPAFPQNEADGFVRVVYGSPAGAGVSPEFSLFTVDIQPGGGGSPVPPIPAGRYAAWCFDATTDIDPGLTGSLYTGALIPTCDPTLDINSQLPDHPDVKKDAATWKRINYLINHRRLACGGSVPTMWEVQRAIYLLMGQTPPPSPPYPSFRSAVVNCLIADATLNAAAWQPTCGDKVATIYNISINWDNLTPEVQLIFIEVPCPCTALGDYVWVDTNKNGKQDEPPGNGVNNVKVELLKCDGTPALDSHGNPLVTTTGNDSGGNPGYYLFPNLIPGCYRVKFTPPCGYGFTTKDAFGTSDANGSDVDNTGVTGNINLPWGVKDLRWDAGLVCLTPVLSGTPADTSYQCLGDMQPAADVTAVDSCGNPIAVDYKEEQSKNGSSCGNIVKRTWTATSACGEVASYTQTIVIQDTTAPLVSVPAGGALGCNPPTLPTDESIKALVSASDNCSEPVVTVTHEDGGTPCFPTRTFKVVVTDACDNAAEARFITYSWKVDALAPTVTTPAAIAYGCNPASVRDDADVKALVTAEDNCDAASDLVITVTHVDGGTDCAKTRTFSITAKDTCGNTSLVKTVVDSWKVDTSAPTVTAPAAIAYGCNPASVRDDAAVKALVTAEDNCDAASDLVITVTHVDGGTECAKTRTFSITAKDTCGNTSLVKTVVDSWKVDTSAPTVTAPAAIAYGCKPASVRDDAAVKALVTAQDNCDAASDLVITVTHVDGGTSCAKTRTFSITAKDTCGNISLTKTVVDTWSDDQTAPTITLSVSGGDLGCNPASIPTDEEVRGSVNATETCSKATLTVTHVDSGTDCAKTRTFSISAKDDCGNVSATKTLVYTWKVDTTGPLLACPPDISIPLTYTGSYAYCGYTQGGWGATCRGNNVASKLKYNFAAIYPSGVEVGIPGAGGYSMKFTSALAVENYLPAGGTPAALTCDLVNPASSASGVFGGQVLALKLNIDYSAAGVICNSGNKIGELVYNDSTSPLNGKTVSQILALANTALGGGNAGVSIATLNSLLTSINEGFDGCKVSAWATEHLLPPGGQADVSPAKTGSPTASDNCGGTPVITYSDVTTQAACAGGYIVTRTWMATDACGNASTCQQIISVGCSAPPALDLQCPSVTAGEVGKAYSSSLVATGGTPGYTFSIIAGALPNSLTLNPTTGAITGTPTVAGSFSFTAKVVDSTGGTAKTKSVNCCIVIAPRQSGGCTLTIGYYKTHPSAVTPLPIYLGVQGGAATLVVSSQTIGVNVLGQRTYGAPANGITKLYAQLLAAKLNGLRGANLTAVSSVISSADTFLASYDYNDWCYLTSTQQSTVLSWVTALDNYNNGVTGPGHCGTTECPRPTSPTPTCGDNKVTLCWQPSNGATCYKVSRSEKCDGPYTAIANCTGTTYTDNSACNGKPYYYVITACKPGVDESDSDEVCAIPCATLPSPWQSRDVGCVIGGGGSHHSSGTFTLSNCGRDIWGNSDACRYTYQLASGDCSIVAKVCGVENTDSWAKAGVMIRETLNADSKHCSAFVTPGNGVACQWRSSTGGSSQNVNTGSTTCPYWVKITRVGNTFTCYRSANGYTWTQCSSTYIPMGTSCYIGLAGTSHDESSVCTATFSNVSCNP